jgi:ABC-type transport system involved in cytochrome c biogenesis permease subunit
LKSIKVRNDSPTRLREIAYLVSQFEQLNGTSRSNEISPETFWQDLGILGGLFKSIPGQTPNNDWYSLHALELPVNNFSAFSDADFKVLQQHYRERSFDRSLNDAYEHFLEKNSSSFYPTHAQLKVETIYYRYPFLELTVFGYLCAFILFAAAFFYTKPVLSKWASSITILAFVFHTTILGMRIFILKRPPVSNMFETVLYVPWVTTLFALILQKRIILFAACFVSLALLLLPSFIQININLENVQPVLNSQFWLTVHVLMVVGSYGLFVLSGVLGHFYLLERLLRKKNSDIAQWISKAVLQTMYAGTALLICGTILGGVWAAQSWGRFWDWDPKESWAFISICTYLVWIHAYRFHHISHFGLAIGAILGLLSISFTWYGVNFILGTGLHSYGFGNGGEIYYYLFLGGEFAFILSMFGIGRKLQSEQN